MQTRQVALLLCFVAVLVSIRHIDVFIPDYRSLDDAYAVIHTLPDVTAPPRMIDPLRGPIPHILWFTYSHNILETKNPEEYYENIKKTIDAYRAVWKESDAQVRFLVNDNCTDLLGQVDLQENTTLALAFKREFRGDLKADICRLAALFLHGGYYFDVDLEVVKPIVLDPTVSFSTARDFLFGYFFQAFLAATPGHPVLKENLHTMMEFYFEKKGTCYEKAKGVMGPCTLMKAWNQTSNRGYSRLLQETHLKWHGLYPNMTQRGHGDACHWVLHDPNEREVYFYSRIQGSTKCGFG